MGGMSELALKEQQRTPKPEPRSEVATHDPTPAVLPVVTAEPRSLLAAIVQLASNPAVDVEKLGALLNMQERMEVRQGEIEFNQALARLSQHMPRVKKNGTVDLGPGKGSYPFAKWEDIDRIIRPLMAEEGFSLSFDAQTRPGEGGGAIITGTLLHRDGHSKSASIPLPLDSGPGRNNLQAMGSSISYGKRYCAEMLLNIVREGADDDAVMAGAQYITKAQLDALNILADQAKADKRAFCERFMGVESMDKIFSRDYRKAEEALKTKLQRTKSNA